MDWRSLCVEAPGAIGPVGTTLDDIDGARRRWGHRLFELLATYDANLRTLEEQRSEATLPSTPRRLDALRAGLAANGEELTEILGALGITPSRPPKKTEPAAAIGAGPLLDGYPQILRDWAWGAETEENERARRAVEDALGDAPLGVGVVLGCGAGRLTCDLARRAGTEALLAIDIDPLPLAVLQRMLSGTATRLHELPRQPRAEAARAWDLTPPEALGAEVIPLFADGRAPRLREGAFDSVVMPWYLDRVDSPPAHTIRVAYNLLRPGGRLVHHGPLIHPSSRPPVDHLGAPELCELMEREGLSVAHDQTARLPYLQSPASAVGRVMDVHTVVAVRDDGPIRDLSPPPAWLSDDRAPVPRPGGLEGVRPPNPVVAEVIRLLDGRRSVRDVAQKVKKKFRLKGNVLADTRDTIRELHRLAGG